MCNLFYHSLFCVPLIMANRFGLTYNPSGLTNYFFPLPPPSPSSDLRMLGHTRIHKEVRDQGTKKREKRHAEQEVVRQKEERSDMTSQVWDIRASLLFVLQKGNHLLM